MFTFLHAADLHLDSPLRGLERYDGAPVDAIRGATRRALHNLVDLAISEQVAFVLLAGDLYDGDWRDYNTGLFFVGQMARLREAGIPAVAVAGDHDAASRLTKALRLPDNVHLLSTKHPETLRLDKWEVAIHGQGYQDAVTTADLSASYPTGDPGLINIGLLHTSLDGRPGHASYAPCSLDGLRGKGYAYWALGHVHTREIAAEAPWVVFPGNTQGRHARETGAKGCTLVTVDENAARDGAVQSATHHPLDVVRWEHLQLDIAGCATPEDLLTRARDTLDAALEAEPERLLALRLTVTGAGSVHERLHAQRERWLNELRAIGLDLAPERLWLEKLRVETRGVVDEQALAARDDAVGALFRGLGEVPSEPDVLAALGADLNALTNRLPPELLNGAEPFDPTAPEQLRAALDDVRSLLLARLYARPPDGGAER